MTATIKTWPAGIEHVILPRGQTYRLADTCWAGEYALDQWPGDFHVIIKHDEKCECPSRGQVFQSAYNAAFPRQVSPPLSPQI